MGKITEESIEREAEKNKSYKYWEYEDPEEYETEKNVLRYFPEAQKLQVASPYYTKVIRTWTETKHQRMPGKPTALDLRALAEDQDTLEWFISILEGLRK